MTGSGRRCHSCGGEEARGLGGEEMRWPMGAQPRSTMVASRDRKPGHPRLARPLSRTVFGPVSFASSGRKTWGGEKTGPVDLHGHHRLGHTDAEDRSRRTLRGFLPSKPLLSPSRPTKTTLPLMRYGVHVNSKVCPLENIRAAHGRSCSHGPRLSVWETAWDTLLPDTTRQGQPGARPTFLACNSR
jgi:hypothetical protein